MALFIRKRLGARKIQNVQKNSQQLSLNDIRVAQPMGELSHYSPLPKERPGNGMAHLWSEPLVTWQALKDYADAHITQSAFNEHPRNQRNLFQIRRPIRAILKSILNP